MSDSNCYVLTATPARDGSNAEETKLYWNADGYAIQRSAWTPKLSDCETFAEEEKAIELKEKLQKMIDETENKKRLIVKNVVVETLDRKQLMIAKMKGL
jgi:hypothetical protein